jgi:hypothetical protein
VGTSELDGLASPSDSDVWAVGFYASGGITHTLAMHWDGSTWSIVPSPDVSGTNSQLAAVSARAAGDIWAVGYSGSSNMSRTLVEHWDGSTWSIVPSPNVDPQGINNLQGVAVVGPNDVWAVGYYGSTPTYQTLTEHWDGTSWSVVPSPNIDTGNNMLYAVAGTAPDDVWAVGTHLQTNINLYRNTFLHWTGSGWTSFVSAPNYGNNYLYGVFMLSQSNAWAVGGEEDMAEHWNGTQWIASGGVLLGDIYGVTATAQNDAWAVGTYSEPGYSTIYHYGGSVWLPFPNNTGTHLRAISTLWREDIWTVGFDDNNHLLIERYNNLCATPTNTPTGAPSTSTPTAIPTATRSATNTHTPTNTPPLTSTPTHANANTNTPTIPTGTNTPFAPTGTPTTAPAASPSSEPSSTPTVAACSLEFTDVPPGSTFYPYIHRLACMGIISGYTSGCSTGNPCFRPDNKVTRGQTAKIVSNVALFNDQILPDTQTFGDVLPGSTFWLHVERVALHGAISGYPCGGPGEPCVPPTNRPYFRPSANLTRGQTAKIVAIAAGLPAPPGGRQTFQDVPEGSTFWTWIEELASTGASNGYTCGGPSEPCIPPLNRPYFRPGSNVTRGQLTKIAAHTFP